MLILLRQLHHQLLMNFFVINLLFNPDSQISRLSMLEDPPNFQLTYLYEYLYLIIHHIVRLAYEQQRQLAYQQQPIQPQSFYSCQQYYHHQDVVSRNQNTKPFSIVFQIKINQQCDTFSLYNSIIRVIRMSHGYGFLTQSTIIPKKSKQIKINDNSGQVLLQSIIQKQREKLKNKTKTQNVSTQAPAAPKKNRGIQQRIKKDQQQEQKTKITDKNSYKILQKKAQIYDKITNKKINIDKLLVDFQAKQLQMNKQQAEQYNKLREAFYKGQINDIESQQKSLHEAVQAQTNTTSQLRQRLTWEKQTLNELKGIETVQKQPKVHQSFDNILSKQQKEAFQKIINEQEQQKARIQAIRRKRQLVQQERIRKLRKLNIIKDVTQVTAPLQRQNQHKNAKKQQECGQQQN